MRHSLAVIGPPPQRKRFAPCSRVSSFPQPICQPCESQIGPCLLGAARVGEDVYHVKVGQIHWSKIQRVRTPAPVVRTLSPFLRGMHSDVFTCGGGGVESTCYIFPLFSGVVVDVLRSIYMRARFVKEANGFPDLIPQFFYFFQLLPSLYWLSQIF